MTEVTLSRLSEVLTYDPETGNFAWLVVPNGRVKVGALAGSTDRHGHRQIQIDGVKHLAHRLAWLFVHGALPAFEIDHRNGVRNDNRIANLREATRAQNNQNIARYSNNRSGYIGVHRVKKTDKWIAQIRFGGKQHYLGTFSTAEEAYAVYLEAKARLHAFQPAPHGERNERICE